MKHTRVVALLFASATLAAAISAHAQGWMYQSGARGTPPFAYGDPYGNLYSQPNERNFPPPSYSIPSSTFQTPSVPHIQSYVPAPSYPSGRLPCTLPIGCD